MLFDHEMGRPLAMFRIRPMTGTPPTLVNHAKVFIDIFAGLASIRTATTG